MCFINKMTDPATIGDDELLLSSIPILIDVNQGKKKQDS